MKQHNLLGLGLALLFTASALTTKAEDKYAKAHIVMHSKDTMNIYVKSTSLYELQNRLEYKDAFGKIHVLTPNDVKSFYFVDKKDTTWFESKRGLNLGFLENDERSVYFMMRVSKNHVPLYYFVRAKNKREGFDEYTQYSPNYLVFYESDWYVMTETNYTSKLIKLFKVLKLGLGYDVLMDFEKLERDIKRDKYKFEEIPEIFEKYNSIYQSQNVR